MSKGTWEVVDDDEPRKETPLEKRAAKRTVERIGKITWRVHGDKKLNDAYPEYLVTLPEGEGKRHYVCDCYKHGHGDSRRKKMCSHVMAVQMFRKTDNVRWVEDAMEIVSITQDILDYPKIPQRKPRVPQLELIEGEGEGSAPRDEAAGRGEPALREVSGLYGHSTGTLNEIAEDPRHDALGLPEIPEKFSAFRPHQWDAIIEVLEHFEAGVRVVMLSAPTGSGKTLIGEAVQRLMPGNNLYCCTTKTLQDQVTQDFPYAVVMKGRVNYRTQHRADVSCEECTGTPTDGYTDCDWCDGRIECPYFLAKQQASQARFPVLNMAYFLGETSNEQSLFADRSIVVIDEADTLEDQLMSQIEVTIGERLRKWLGIRGLPKKTVPDDWARWLDDEVRPAIGRKRTEVSATTRTLMGADPKKLKQLVRLDRLRDKIRPLVRNDGEAISEGWVMTGYDKSGGGDVTFKPITVAEHAEETLWERGRQYLLMTATLISPEQTAMDLGLEDDDWEVVQMDSTFPPENRPVIVDPVARMTMKTEDVAWPKMVVRIDEILDENPGVRILVHTVSYRLTEYLYNHSKSGRLLTYRNASEREATLERFLETPDAVLLAPSFDRGVDLPEEACEVIIIAKVPYPYLGDKQIKAKLYSKGGKTWYAVQTIRAIVQMCGRGMRSSDDWCDCVDPSTLVLTDDLRWVPAGDLKVGDGLMAFGEKQGTRLVPRRWERGEVISTGIKTLDRFEIKLASGHTLIATPNHRWLSKWGQSRDDKWVRTDTLRPGHHLNRYVKPWPQVESYDVGWLSAFFDGEGSLTLRSGKRNPTVSHIVVSQLPGIVMDKAIEITERLGFQSRLSMQASGVEHLNIQGGLPEHLRFLGQVRPIRLLAKFLEAKVLGRLMTTEYDEVVSVQPIEPGPMVTLQSSTETYIADGYGAHNTYILDGQFKRLWSEHKRLFPGWFREAVAMSQTDPKYAHLVDAAEERRANRQPTREF